MHAIQLWYVFHFVVERETWMHMGVVWRRGLHDTNEHEPEALANVENDC